MKNMHWRYNFNMQDFEFAEHHYSPLLKHVHIPTLVIDIYSVQTKNLAQYLCDVLEKAQQKQIRYSQIVFDATLDPLIEWLVVVEILNNFSKQKSIRCYLATSQFEVKTHSHLVEIIYPSWLFAFKQQQLPAIQEKDKKYKFSCLNRNPIWHRLLFYTLVKQSGLLDQFVYSFYDRCPYRGHKVKSSMYGILRDLVGEKMYQECLINTQDFPISWNNEILGENDHSIGHDAYYDTWCNIVTETSAMVPFTSEKIWKPIAAGQMFLVVGPYGTTHWLNSLNINTFNDLYDSEPDVVKRLTQVIRVVQEHASDPRSWWMQNKDAIGHNYEHFHSGNVEKMLLEPIIPQLNNK